MTIEQIINKLKSERPDADLDMLKLAYDFALKAHGKQKRKTGEPYIQHSLHTSFLLVQIKADFPSIVAGLLHDVPEDTPYTLDDVRTEFGDDL